MSLSKIIKLSMLVNSFSFISRSFSYRDGKKRSLSVSINFQHDVKISLYLKLHAVESLVVDNFRPMFAFN